MPQNHREPKDVALHSGPCQVDPKMRVVRELRRSPLLRANVARECRERTRVLCHRRYTEVHQFRDEMIIKEYVRLLSIK
jgi:hypothetical protein